MTKRRRPSVLANRTATVGINRNGLVIEVTGVPATEAVLVAQYLLNGVRQLVKVGYEELIPDSGSFHSTGHVVDDDDLEEVVEEPKQMGFR